MKTSIISILLFGFTIVLQGTAETESIIRPLGAVDPAYPEIVSIVQVGSEVHLFHGEFQPFLLPGTQPIYTMNVRSLQAEILGPSLAVKKTILLDNRIGMALPDDSVVLWQRGTGTGEPYDYQRGTGWIDNGWLEWFYIREYPWIYLHQRGWAYVMLGPQLSLDRSQWIDPLGFFNEIEVPLPACPPPHYRNIGLDPPLGMFDYRYESWYLWLPLEGWALVSYDWHPDCYYSYAAAAWKSWNHAD